MLAVQHDNDDDDDVCLCMYDRAHYLCSRMLVTVPNVV